MGKSKDIDHFPFLHYPHCIECGGTQELMLTPSNMGVCRWCIRKVAGETTDIINPTAYEKENKVVRKNGDRQVTSGSVNMPINPENINPFDRRSK